MRRPGGLLIGLVLLTACTISVPRLGDPAAPPTSTDPPSLDPSDPEVARRLGAGPPEGIDWRRQVAGLTVVGIDTRPDPEELALIEGAIAEIPEPLHQLARPRTIVRIPTIDDDTHEAAAAYARGADIYLLDRTFRISPGGSTRMDMSRAYAHELAHVAQYHTLRPEYVRAVLEGGVRTVDPSAGSALVLDFAAATGWRDRGDDPLRPAWHLPDHIEASTEYGRLRPDEDMAEAVAMVVLGRAEWIPSDRVTWVEGWLDRPAGELGTGKPWAPAGSEEVLSEQPLYDEDRVAGLRDDFSRAEPLYFALPARAPAHEELARLIEERLRERGLEGSLGRSPDDRLPRHEGLFMREDGVASWVELWDFREQDGFQESPEHPVLTYVLLW